MLLRWDVVVIVSIQSLSLLFNYSIMRIDVGNEKRERRE